MRICASVSSAEDLAGIGDADMVEIRLDLLGEVPDTGGKETLVTFRGPFDPSVLPEGFSGIVDVGEEDRPDTKLRVLASHHDFEGTPESERLLSVLNGMDAAHLLREKDNKVMLIFVTSMRQYALQGYDVAAADFIVKPVPYAEFTLKFTRALAKLPQTKAEDLLLRLTADRIRYVEVRGHHCAYHTDTSTYQQYQTMKAVEDALPKDRFARCNNFLLVNLAFVEKIEDLTVWVAGEALPISHPRKKPFFDAFARFAGSKQHD